MKLYPYTLFILFKVFIIASHAKNYERKCANDDCSEKISEGLTTQTYSSPKKDILSFKIDEPIHVYSKEVGENSELWEVIVKGKRGYVPKKFIRENKVFVKKDALISVSAEDNSNKSAKDFHPLHGGNKEILKSDVLNISEPESAKDKNTLNVDSQQNENSASLASHKSKIPKEANEELEKSKSSAFTSSTNSPDPPSVNSDFVGTNGISEESSQSGGIVSALLTNIPESSNENKQQEQQPSKENIKSDLKPPAEFSNEENHEASEKTSTGTGDKKNKNEEMDNEDEGNGNEGEENGSENKLENVISSKTANREGLEVNVAEEKINPIVPNSITEKESNAIEDIPSKSPVPEKDDTAFDPSYNSIQHEPTQKYEVVHGTTIYESEPLVNSVSDSELNEAFLKPSEPSHENYASKTVEMPHVMKEAKMNTLNEKVHKDENIHEGEIVDKNDKLSTSEIETVYKEGKNNENLEEDTIYRNNLEIDRTSELEIKNEHKEDKNKESLKGNNYEVNEDYSETDMASEIDIEKKDTKTINHDNLENIHGSFAEPKPESIFENDESSSNVKLNSESILHSESFELFQNSSDDSSTVLLEVENGLLHNNEATEISLTQDTKNEADTINTESQSEGPLGFAESNEMYSTLKNLVFTDPETSKTENDQTEKGESAEGYCSSKESSCPVSKSDDGFSQISKKHKSIPGTLKKRFLEITGAVLNEKMTLAIEQGLEDPRFSTRTIIFLVIASATVAILYLLHMIVVKSSRESPLLKMINELDRKYRILYEENNNFKQQMTNSNGQIKISDSSDPLELQTLKQQFELSEKKLSEEIEELQNRNQQLENDLESSTANEVELHRMLDELLANQKETSNFEESVNGLQSMLDNQREVVENLTSDLALKTRLNDELKGELKANKSKNSKLEYQIEQLSHSLEEATTTKNELLKKLSEEECSVLSLKDINNSLRQEFDRISKDSQRYLEDVQNLSQDLKNLKQKLRNKEAECQVSRECLKKVQAFTDAGDNNAQQKLGEVFRIVEVKSRMESLEAECSSLKAELKDTEHIQKTQNEGLRRAEAECTSLRKMVDTLQKERDDAKARLQVLTQHYEEKENQLKKELESQEGLLQSVEGSASVVSNRIQAYELELSSCRSQIEGLKSELEEQKQSHKIQLTNEERKLHETWLTARAAERRQEELRQENAQLRQKFTQMQKDPSSQNLIIKPTPKRVDGNGSVSSPIPLQEDSNQLHSSLSLDLDGPMTLPPPMMPPMFPGRPPLPPPHPGMPGLPPPPPLPPHLFGPLPHPPPMPDRRLPPAGRIASPTGYDRRSYSPGSDRSHYSDQRCSPGPRYYHRGHSPDDSKSDHSRRNDSTKGQRSPSPTGHSSRRTPPDRWYTQSPQGLAKHRRSPPLDYFENVTSRMNSSQGQKTSTPLGVNDR